jgi:hypothetical protein
MRNGKDRRLNRAKIWNADRGFGFIWMILEARMLIGRGSRRRSARQAIDSSWISGSFLDAYSTASRSHNGKSC